MKPLLTTLITLIISLSMVHAENLFDNSQMDTSAAWRGDRKFEELDGNRVIAIEADKNKKLGFFQNAKTKGKREVVLKFRYQTKDYAGNGIDVRALNRAKGSIFFTINPKADGQWQTKTLTFHNLEEYNEASFVISLNKGEGTVYFDDITLEAK